MWLRSKTAKTESPAARLDLPLAQLPDALLVREAKLGNALAYSELTGRYQDRIFTLVLAKIQSREDAIDVTQDVFVRAHRRLESFREDSLATGYQVELNLDDRPATVQADEEALGRALRNLMENAVKYSPECRTIWVDGALHEHHAAVSVRDRGIGERVVVLR